MAKIPSKRWLIILIRWIISTPPENKFENSQNWIHFEIKLLSISVIEIVRLKSRFHEFKIKELFFSEILLNMHLLISWACMFQYHIHISYLVALILKWFFCKCHKIRPTVLPLDLHHGKFSGNQLQNDNIEVIHSKNRSTTAN